MNPELLRNANQMLLDDIAFHASELSELLNKVKKMPSTHKNIVSGIFYAANVELERRGQVVNFEAEEGDTGAEV